MNGAGRSRVFESIEWLDERWGKLQTLAMGIVWLRGLIVNPMTPFMILIYTLASLLLVITFRQFINPILDNAADGLVKLIIQIIQVVFYLTWPLIPNLPPILFFLAENASQWPLLWEQTTLAINSCCRLYLIQAEHSQLTFILWLKRSQNRASLGGRYSIAKVPYRLYPMSCILLE